MKAIQYKRKIYAAGRSTAIILPPSLVKAMQLTIGEMANVQLTKKGILISKEQRTHEW